MIKLLYLRPLYYVSSTQADYFKLSTPETFSVCVGDFTEIMERTRGGNFFRGELIWSCSPQPKLSSHNAFQTLSVGILCQRPAHVELQQLGHRPWRLAHASMCCSFIPDSPTRLPYSQRPNPLPRQWYGDETCYLSRGESQRWEDVRYQTSQGRAGWHDHGVNDSWFRQEERRSRDEG